MARCVVLHDRLRSNQGSSLVRGLGRLLRCGRPSLDSSDKEEVMQICYWCGEGFKNNEPRVGKDGNKTFHLFNSKGVMCIEEYRKELRRIVQEEDRRRKAFEKMG